MRADPQSHMLNHSGGTQIPGSLSGEGWPNWASRSPGPPPAGLLGVPGPALVTGTAVWETRRGAGSPAPSHQHYKWENALGRGRTTRKSQHLRLPPHPTFSARESDVGSAAPTRALDTPGRMGVGPRLSRQPLPSASLSACFLSAKWVRYEGLFPSFACFAVGPAWPPPSLLAPASGSLGGSRPGQEGTGLGSLSVLLWALAPTSAEIKQQSHWFHSECGPLRAGTTPAPPPAAEELLIWQAVAKRGLPASPTTSPCCADDSAARPGPICLQAVPSTGSGPTPHSNPV